MSKRRLSAEELARQDERQAALGRIQGRWVENANSHGHHYEHDAPPTLEEMLARAMTRIVELETELDARINWAAAHESQKVESEVSQLVDYGCVATAATVLMQQQLKVMTEDRDESPTTERTERQLRAMKEDRGKLLEHIGGLQRQLKVMTEDRDEYADALYRYKRMTREQRDAVNLFADHITMKGRP